MAHHCPERFDRKLRESSRVVPSDSLTRRLPTGALHAPQSLIVIYTLRNGLEPAIVLDFFFSRAKT